MKGYLLDTSSASALWDELHVHHKIVREFLKEIDESAPVFISPIVFGEIAYGYEIHEAADQQRKEAIQSKLREFDASQILPITEHTAEAYGALRARLFNTYAPRPMRRRARAKWPEDLIDKTTSKALGVQENDVWLAAQALERNLVLVTNDKMTHIGAVAADLQLKILRN